MCKDNVLVLTLDSTAFSKMKEDFNSILKKTLGNMQVKESKEATLTLKLNISLTDAEAPDFSVPYGNAMRNIKKPRFDHKISSVMQIKNEESGSLKGEYELVWDDDLLDWVMKPIDNGQKTLFDDDIINGGYAVADYVDDIKEDEAKGLPEPKKLIGASIEDGYGYEEDGDE